MSSYFNCPGVATASATTVECSVPIETYTPPESEWLSVENFNALMAIVLTYWAIHFVFQQIKKAIEI